MFTRSRLVTQSCRLLVVVSILLTSVPTPMSAAVPAAPPSAADEEAAGSPATSLLNHWTSLITKSLEKETSKPGAPSLTFDSPLPTLEPPPGDPLQSQLIVEPDTAIPGDVVTYTLAVSNTGELAVQSGVLVAHVPEQVDVLEVEGATYDTETRELHCELDWLEPGQGVTVTWRGQVVEGAEMTVVENEAIFTSNVIATEARFEPGQVHRGGDETVTTATATLLVGKVAVNTLTPKGGELVSSDGRVRVVAPAGAVTETMTATMVSYPVRELGQVGNEHAVRFGLEPDLHFAAPVTVTVELQGLVPLRDLPPGWRPYLAYLKDPTRRQWEDVPLKGVNWDTGVITAQLEHFSEYAAGAVSENGWRLLFNDAVVDSFRGAASYQSPLNVPPGRGGLQPHLSLTYNSDRIDGIMAKVQSDWVGLGWSLDVPQIVRHVHWCSSDYYLICTDIAHPDYTLIIDGTGYTLVPDPDDVENPAEDHPTRGVGRYHTDKETFFFVEKRFTDSNELGTYWLVKTRDGTEYHFGYTWDAEQVVDHVAYLDDHKVTYRWRLNRIVDVWGNEVVFEYVEETKRASYLSNIKYNEKSGGTWGTQILFDLRPRSGDPDGGDRKENLFFQQKHLDGVRVLQNGQLVREYRLGYDFHKSSRRLQSVREYGAGGSTLPATTFYYQLFDNTRQDWGGGKYPYSRLVTVENGYGGRIEIDYERDTGKPDHYYHYRVRQRDTLDGLGNTTQRIYRYGPPCMDETGSKCDDGYRKGALKGYEWSAEEIYDDGILLNKTTTSFVLEWPLTGRVGVQEVMDSQEVIDSQVRRRTETEWGYTWLIPSTVDYTTGVAFFHADQVATTDYSGSGAVSTRVGYTYDNYGNLVAEYHYGAEEPVINAGFEAPLSEVWAAEENWSAFGSPTPASISTGVAFAGRRSLQLQGSSNGGVCQDIGGLVPGQAYVVRVQVKAAAGTTARFQLWLHDTEEGNTVRSPATTPSTAWSQVSLNYTANATGKVRIHLYYLAGSGTIYVDAVALARAQDVGDERSVHRTFYHNDDPSVWIVNKPARETVYEGIVATDSPISFSSKVQTRYYYDGHSSYTTSPTQGALTRVDQGTGERDWLGNWIEWITTYYAYDDWGNLRFETDPNGNVTEILYDTTYHQFPVEVINAKRQTSHTDYYGVNDAECIDDGYYFGAVCRAYGPNGTATATRYTYDAFGRLRTIVRPYDVQEHPTEEYLYYDGVDRPLTDDWPLMITHLVRGTSGVDWWSGGIGWWERSFYDGLGRLVETHHPDADWSATGGGHEITSYTIYDALGRAVQQSVPYQVPQYTYKVQDDRVVNPYRGPDLNQPYTESQYDGLGRVTQVVNPDDTSTRTYYQGWKTAIVDANGHQRIQESDAFGRLVKVQEFEGVYAGEPGWSATPYATTRYIYDVLDNLTDVWDAADNHTQMWYDALGRKTEMHDPDMGEWEYDYDPAGNLVWQEDVKGQWINFEYDELNRLVSKSRGVLPLALYRYDEEGHGYGVGHRTSMIGESDSASWTYDKRGRMTEEEKTITGVDTFATQYTYDAMDRVVDMTYPDGEVVHHTYDNQGLLNSVSGSSTYVQSTTYDASGRVDLRVVGNNVLQTDYVYYPWKTANGMGRLRHIEMGTSGNPTLRQHLEYWYDSVGNVARIKDHKAGPQDQHFTYDALYRLTRARTTGGGQGSYDRHYDYDKIGNIQFRTGVGDYDYPLSGPVSVHPHAATEAGDNSYTYDENGNMVSRDEDGTIYTQEFDAENRLARVTVDGQTTEFTYDGDGNLVKKDDATGTTVYVGEHYEVLVPAPTPTPTPTPSPTPTPTPSPTPTPGPPSPPTNLEATYHGDIIMGGQSRNPLRRPPDGYVTLSWQPSSPPPGVTFRVYRSHTSPVPLDAAHRIASGLTWGGYLDSAGQAGDYYVVTAVNAHGESGPSNTAWAQGGGVLESRSMRGGGGDEVVTKYYYVGSQRVAMRRDGVVYYLHTDHLGSTSLTTNSGGGVVAEQRYYPYGGARWTSGELPTDRRFTGQRWEQGLGLYDYNARFYDPTLGRFISADTIVPQPGNPQDLNRYAYARNNPVLYADPSGHNPILGFMLIAAGVAALAVEVPQISSYAERHDMSFWEAAVDPDLYLDQAAMADAAVKGAFAALVAAESVPLALAGGGAALAEYGMRTGNIGAWETAASLNNAAAGVDAWLWGVGESTTARLQGLADQATQDIDALGDAAYSQPQLDAMAANPNLRPPFRGSAIDARFKELIIDDPQVSHLQTSRLFQFMPDVVDPLTGRWWDLTTFDQWQKHLDKYGAVYGSEGTLITHP